uniref:Uncharacterized protein n=1 Tax=Anguilla anguilla TaxID=7936 RepID=A0A0E9W401_ANGAN
MLFMMLLFLLSYLKTSGVRFSAMKFYWVLRTARKHRSTLIFSHLLSLHPVQYPNIALSLS